MSPSRRSAATEVLAGALVLGVATGLIELIAIVLRREINGRWLGVGGDALWLIPLTYVVGFGLLAVPLAALEYWRGNRRFAALTWYVLSFLGAISVLLAFRRSIGMVAVVVLALGLARVVGGLLRRGWPQRGARLSMGALALLLLAVVSGAGLRVAAWRREDRAHAAGPAARPGAPNILLLILDTVRAAELSLHGLPIRTSPELERWAQHGVTFGRAISPSSWTLPSHAVYFTGRRPHTISADWWTPLDDRPPTLAEVLSRHGYATAGFTANLVNLSRESGIARGFQHYEDFEISLGQGVASTSLGQYLASNRRLRRVLGTWQLPNRKPAGRVNTAFLDWRRGTGERPWFAFLNYFDAHAPYIPTAAARAALGQTRHPAPLLERLSGRRSDYFPSPSKNSPIELVREDYQAAIWDLDHAVGALLDSLAATGELQRTVVVITADHGEEFGLRGAYEHGVSLNPVSVHVPLLVLAPGQWPTGMRVDRTVSLQNLPATILDLAGIRGGLIPGFSLARMLSPSAQDTALAELSPSPSTPGNAPASEGPLQSLTTDSLHIVRDTDGAVQVFGLEGPRPVGEPVTPPGAVLARLLSALEIRAPLAQIRARPSIFDPPRR